MTARTWGRCPNCHRYGHLPHGCIAYEVAMAETPDYWFTIYATDAESAIEAFAEQYDCEGDYTIVQAGESGDFKVLCRLEGNEESQQLYSVYGEAVPKYYVRGPVEES